MSNFKFSINKQREFLKLWHYHPELEFVYIINGEGTLYAGDFIGDFRKDDIFLLGNNLPHMFHSNVNQDNDTASESLVFHINESFLLENFCKLPEFLFLQHVVTLSKRGVMFRQESNLQILQILFNLQKDSPSRNAIKILQLLLRLSEFKDPCSLGSQNWLNHFKISDKRVNNVIEHMMLHFKEDITLEKAADISGMNKSAFCRYFKKNTGKSFISFLNEIRINYSCKLLREVNPSKSISEACYLSGFNSLSYYNRTFKKTIGISPSEYRSKDCSPGSGRPIQAAPPRLQHGLYTIL